jgi:LysR family transcriptional activator of nhaA
MPTVDSKIRSDLENTFRLAGIQIDVVAETQDTATQKLMGAAGLGLIPISRTAAHECLRRRELVEIGRMPGLNEDLFLISATRKIENPVSSALMRTFRMPSVYG